MDALTINEGELETGGDDGREIRLDVPELALLLARDARRLARAAVRVRLGRAREVVVPRLPDEPAQESVAAAPGDRALQSRLDDELRDLD